MSREQLALLVRGAAAFSALLVLVVAVPAILAVGVGWPLPHAVPTIADLHRVFSGRYHPTGSFYLRVVAAVAWVAWIEIAACAAVELRAALTGRRPWHVRFAGPIQPLIASLVAVVILTLPPTGSRSPTRAPSLAVALAPSGPARRAVLMDDALRGPAPSRDTSHPAHRLDGDQRRGEPVRITVRQHDTLWSLAEQYLGNPLDWNQIFELNVGKPQPGGGVLTDPSLIKAGWVLELPPRAAANVPEERRAPRPHHERAQHPTAKRDSHEHRRQPPATARRPARSGRMPAPPPRTGPHHMRPPHHMGEPPQSRLTASAPLVELPTGAVVSTSFLAGVAAAVALGRLRRRRGYRPRRPSAGWSGREWEPSAPLSSLLRAARGDVQDEDDRTGEDSKSIDAAVPETPVPLGQVLAGRRNDKPIVMPIVMPIANGGIAFDGPGAAHVIRALVADVVTRHEAGYLECVVDAAFWPALLGDVEPFPGLRRLEPVDGFVREAEVELIRRVRLFEDEELEDPNAYWQAHPEEPMPVLLLVCRTPSANLDGRLAGVLRLGARVGIGAFLLGDGGCAPTVTVGKQGLVDESAVAELKDAELVHIGMVEVEAALQAVGSVRLLEVEPEIEESVEADNPSNEASELPRSASDAPVRVELLGAFRILVGNEEVRTGMRLKARELTRLVLLSPGGRHARSGCRGALARGRPEEGQPAILELRHKPPRVPPRCDGRSDPASTRPLRDAVPLGRGERCRRSLGA